MLSRKKKSYHFPTRSIAACLDYFKIGLDDVSQVVTDYMDQKSFIDTSLNYRHLIGDYIRQNLNLAPEQIGKPVFHHTAHAMAAWSGSGFQDAAFLAIDGLGSLQSTHSVFVTSSGNLEKIFSQTTPGIGALYTLVTELIGFKSGEEGKTMGLAPYGAKLRESKNYPEIDFKAKHNGLSIDYSEIINRSPDKRLLTDFGINNFPKDDLYKDFRAHMAFSVQKELETCLLLLAEEIRKTTGKSKICISGGVALNCVANELLTKSHIFDAVYVFPDSADSGLPVGLAFQGVKNVLTPEQWMQLINSRPYPKFAPDECVPIVYSQSIDRLPWKPIDLERVLDHIEKNSVVAVYFGGNEYGPRALGRRSFLANSTFPNMKNILNKKIKHREAYRPFAPICLIEDFDNFFISSHKNHENMTYAVDTTDLAKKIIPAVVHKDGTSRVQIATPDCGVAYHLLIGMKKRHGFGILINTSMNDNDEPIVFDRLDALSCFLRTDADILILNDKMLLRDELKASDELRKNIELEVESKNYVRFESALQKILKKEKSSLNLFLSDYMAISKFLINNKARFRLIQIASEIKTESRRRYTRLVVSKREIDTLNKILSDNFYSINDLSFSLLLIDDSANSFNLLEHGDFVISYNLSNLIRDYGELGLFSPDMVFNFYSTNDFPLRRSSFMDVVDVESTNKILNSYENFGSLTIESAFRKDP
jgi:carbamoyltransferase